MNTWVRILSPHWGRMTHICVGKLTIIGSDNGLSPDRHQAIIWTNAGILLIRPLGTNFSENLIGIQTFSLKKMHSKMSSAKWRPFCLGLNVLNTMMALWLCATQEDNNPRFRRCDEGYAFGIAILQDIDKGVPVLSAGFQYSHCKSSHTTIFHLPCMRIAIKTIFLVSASHVYEQNGFGLQEYPLCWCLNSF